MSELPSRELMGLVDEEAVPSAEVEAFVTNLKDAHHSDRGMMWLRRLCSFSNWSRQSDTGSPTVHALRLGVFISVHLIPIIVVRLCFVGIIAAIAVVELVLLTSRASLARALLEPVKLREHFIRHGACSSHASPCGRATGSVRSDLCFCEMM